MKEVERGRKEEKVRESEIEMGERERVRKSESEREREREEVHLHNLALLLSTVSTIKKDLILVNEMVDDCNQGKLTKRETSIRLTTSLM